MMRVLAWPLGKQEDLNPYTRLMYSRFEKWRVKLIEFRPTKVFRERVDIFHIQWPEAIFEGRGGRVAAIALWKARCVLRTSRLCRRNGGQVVLTIHNLAPHATLTGWRAALWHWFSQALLGQVDHIIGLSQDSIDQFRDKNPIVRSVHASVVHHPHYRSIYAPVPYADARQAMGLPSSEQLTGILGTLRPSKLAPEAIAAFRQIDSDGSLLVCGDSDDVTWSKALDAARGATNVILRRGRMSDLDLAAAISAVDAVLINQAGTLNSGTALLALSLGRPVIAPAVGSLLSLQRLIGSNWVRLFEPPLTAADLRSLLCDLPNINSPIDLDLEKLSPDVLSRQLLELFESLSGHLQSEA